MDEPQIAPRRVVLYLIRHGQTPYNVEHRLPGQLPDIHLNEVGVRQAQDLSIALRDLPLTAVVTSPLERARETAEIVTQGRDVPLTFDPRLMDIDVGRWSGQVIGDLEKQDPEWKRFAQRPTHPPAGIEGFYAVLARAVAAVEAVRHDEALGNYIMVVAHADVLKLLLTHYLRLPIENASWLFVPNAAVTTLAFEGDRDPTLIALNWTPSPVWLRPEPPATSKDEVSEATTGDVP